MIGKKFRPFSNLKFENWKNLLLFAVFLFYFLLLISWIWKGNFLSDYGSDYLAFWSAGKIADENGYSEIYDLNNLSSVQKQALLTQGNINNKSLPSYSPNPAPVFSIFILPFQFLSRIDIRAGYWTWTIINLAILIVYLVSFLNSILPGSEVITTNAKTILLVLASFPVFSNIFQGQVQVFPLVCVGEFIRYALRKNLILSGVWLGGLLLKPQLLIIIIPLILIMRNWKTLIGFIVSSGVVLITSFMLSGFAGINALINLWTKYSVGMATNAPEFMINWRMIGLNLNHIFNTSFGWVITGVGMALTVYVVWVLIKFNPLYGSSQWVISMLGIFSATLIFTWHSHYHMALVLLPFFVFALIHKLVREEIVFFWVILTPTVLFGVKCFSLIYSLLTKTYFIHEWELIGFSGFIVNVVLLISTLRYFMTCDILENKIQEEIAVSSETQQVK